ncbi:hypothetical protein BSU04_10305 [Caballeronia sordidicola]|uniref:Uncharacterized protein n=1 Tax=Caballeronia sordidicola TaxID=196367 RepID=A0A226X5I3_CABSO|nr:hypothetical protein BSU04_10305 [Caballeronia sordidicola]
MHLPVDFCDDTLEGPVLDFIFCKGTVKFLRRRSKTVDVSLDSTNQQFAAVASKVVERGGKSLNFGLADVIFFRSRLELITRGGCCLSIKHLTLRFFLTSPTPATPGRTVALSKQCCMLHSLLVVEKKVTLRYIGAWGVKL